MDGPVPAAPNPRPLQRGVPVTHADRGGRQGCWDARALTFPSERVFRPRTSVHPSFSGFVCEQTCFLLTERHTARGQDGA